VVERARIWFITLRADGHFWALVKRDDFLHPVKVDLDIRQKRVNLVGHILPGEERINIDVAIPRVAIIDVYENGTPDIDASIAQHPDLEGDVIQVYSFGRSGGFHFIQIPSIDADRHKHVDAGARIAGSECRLVRRTSRLEGLIGERDCSVEGTEILAKVNAVREQPSRQIAHHSALVKDGLGTGVWRRDGFAAVEGMPEQLRALQAA